MSLWQRGRSRREGVVVVGVMLNTMRGGRWQEERKEGGEIKGVNEKRKVREKEENKRTFIINSLNRQAVRLRCRPCSAYVSLGCTIDSYVTLKTSLSFPHLWLHPYHLCLLHSSHCLDWPLRASQSHVIIPSSSSPFFNLCPLILAGPSVKYELPVAYWSHV